jgi:CheY-like chemotaxis protein
VPVVWDRTYLALVHDDDQDTREAISRQLSKIEEAVTWSAQGQLEAAKLWRTANLYVGAPAALLAAAAGVTVLASTTGRMAAGIVAIAAAGLGAVATILNAPKRAEIAESAGNKYLAIQQDASIAREVDLPRQGVEEARLALHKLAARRQEVNAGVTAIPRLAYRRARRYIEGEGGQTYQADAG